jgi:CheY-like chemotaxis protein
METQARMEHDHIRPSPALRARQRRIVLAEDDSDLRCLIASQLRALGYHVVEAGTGAELLDRLGDALLSSDHGTRPDLIISDIWMPGFTGLEVLAGLRDAQWHTAMVVMTAYADPTTRARLKELGADAFFQKPFDIDDLLTVVVNLEFGRRGGQWH